MSRQRVHGLNGKTVTVVNVNSFNQTQLSYDLTIEDVHTYYVEAGDLPVLVHNRGVEPLDTQVKGPTQRPTNSQASDLEERNGYRIAEGRCATRRFSRTESPV